MAAKILSKIKKNILVVGSMYDNLNIISDIDSSNYEWIIFNGNICFPNTNIDTVIKRVEKFEQIKPTNSIYVAGGRDLELLSVLLKSGTNYDLAKWIMTKPYMVCAEFTGTKTLIMDGGITPKMKSISNVADNLEICFVSTIRNKPWSDFYRGTMGNIISNNPTESGNPKFLGYAAHIGLPYSDKTILALEVNKRGIARQYRFN